VDELGLTPAEERDGLWLTIAGGFGWVMVNDITEESWCVRKLGLITSRIEAVGALGLIPTRIFRDYSVVSANIRADIEM